MNMIIRCVAITAAFLAAPAAMAETAPETAPVATAAPAATAQLKSGALLVSADGKRIGRIERIEKSADGSPVSAAVIYDSRFIRIPASTISASEHGFSTTLTRTDIRKLK